MPSPTRGVPVQLDRERHLRFPLGVLRNLSKDTDLLGLLHLGLKHEDPDLTPEQLADIVDLEMLPGLAEPMKKASGGLIDMDAILSDGPEPEPGKPPARKTAPKKGKKKGS